MSQPTRDNEPGEFTGYPGTIQPEPHELNSVEQARLERRMDPADPSDTIEAARDREVNGR